MNFWKKNRAVQGCYLLGTSNSRAP